MWDVGPYFDANLCGPDYYWNTGSVPRAVQFAGQRRCNVCGSNCASDQVVINSAIIDISPAMMSTLGATTDIPNACWKFT